MWTVSNEKNMKRKQIAIAATGLTMKFGSLLAVDKVDLEIEKVYLWFSWTERFRKINHNKNVMRPANSEFRFGYSAGLRH